MDALSWKCFSQSRISASPCQRRPRVAFLQQQLSLEAPPSPLSSRPKRGAVERSQCGCSFLEMFFDRAGFPLRAASEDHAWLLFSNNSLWKHRPSLCHLDRSAAQWRDLSVDAPSWKCFSTEPDFCFAQLAKATFAPLREEPDADRQSHGSPQEIRGSAVEGPAVALPEYSHTLFRSPELFLFLPNSTRPQPS